MTIDLDVAESPTWFTIGPTRWTHGVYTDEGVREGVYCIGAPVFDSRGDVVAGIGMCLQKSARQQAARQAQRRHVVDVAARLTRRLGGRPT